MDTSRSPSLRTPTKTTELENVSPTTTWTTIPSTSSNPECKTLESPRASSSRDTSSLTQTTTRNTTFGRISILELTSMSTRECSDSSTATTSPEDSSPTRELHLTNQKATPKTCSLRPEPWSIWSKPHQNKLRWRTTSRWSWTAEDRINL